ncbi:MAG TPA: biopolymer transporter ExbD [Isosphaeraceae bacterium]|jgi:biopolymer transport protein ExbD|nr:biopolymer transporter ExbD [Isosphaeraceae bacterium]
MPGRSRERGAAEVSLNLTPLLDVVLQLITFFMMLVHFGARIEGATATVRLPVAPAALPTGELALDRLVATVDRRGAIVDGRRALLGPAAAVWWREQARARREGQAILEPKGAAEELPTLVIIRADRDAAYGDVRRTLATAQERGFAHFTIVVIRERAP